MKKWENYIMYLIVATLLFAVAVQSYWNYKGYLQNKQHIVNEIQQSLNNAIEEYYAIEAKKNTISISMNDSTNVKKQIQRYHLDSLVPDRIQKMSIVKHGNSIKQNNTIDIFSKKMSFDNMEIHSKVTSIIVSITNDSIDFQRMDSLFSAQLSAQNIDLVYGFQHWKKDSLVYENNQKQVANGAELQPISTFLKKDERLLLRYNPPMREILFRSLCGIVFSVFLVLAILGSLSYLLYIIRQQKQISEMKNDLISNITHEFKTPIATASAAIEAMRSFKVLEDKNKTDNYLQVSENQLKKLHLMVEKLLETASLDSAEIVLQKEKVDLVYFVKKQVEKFSPTTSKIIHFQTELKTCEREVDSFHFENMLGNLLDNAIKYGGDSICVFLNRRMNGIELKVQDNGEGIKSQYRQRIFEKFYRIPKGNRHDVKGFGVGLYYAQQIVQKHGGTLELIQTEKETIFSLKLPNE